MDGNNATRIVKEEIEECSSVTKPEEKWAENGNLPSLPEIISTQYNSEKTLTQLNIVDNQSGGTVSCQPSVGKHEMLSQGIDVTSTNEGGFQMTSGISEIENSRLFCDPYHIAQYQHQGTYQNCVYFDQYGNQHVNFQVHCPDQQVNPCFQQQYYIDPRVYETPYGSSHVEYHNQTYNVGNFEGQYSGQVADTTQYHTQSTNMNVETQLADVKAWSQGTPIATMDVDEKEIKDVNTQIQELASVKKEVIETPACANTNETVATVQTTSSTQQPPLNEAAQPSLAPPSFYQNVPPPNLIATVPVCGVKVPFHPNLSLATIPAAAEVTTPCGEKLYIPLDSNLYELKRKNCQTEEQPELLGLHVFKKESELDGYEHSPRPVQFKGSISDEEGSDFDCATDVSRSSSIESAGPPTAQKQEPEMSESTHAEEEHMKKIGQSEENENETTLKESSEVMKDTKYDTPEVLDNAATSSATENGSQAFEATESLHSVENVPVDKAPVTPPENDTLRINSTTCDSSICGSSASLDVCTGANSICQNFYGPQYGYGQQCDQFSGSVSYDPSFLGCFNQQPEAGAVFQHLESPIGESYHFHETSWQGTWQDGMESVDCTVTDNDNGETQQPEASEMTASENQPMYPALHVSEDGLVTVILRHGVFLEMTADKDLRLVCHDKKLVVAMCSDGGSACIIHPAAKVFQRGTTVDVDLYLARKVKIATENTIFGNHFNTFVFDYTMVKNFEGFPNFLDQSEDRSVGFLCTDTGFFNLDVSLRTSEIVSRAYFEMYQSNGCKVIVNGIKIVQNDNGDVSVYSGPIKFLRLSPTKSILRLKSPFLEADIETNWNVKIRRGTHTLNASYLGLILSNGKIKACIDQNNKLQAFMLPEHKRLNLGEQLPERRPGVARQKYINLPERRPEPEGDHWGYPRQHGY